MDENADKVVEILHAMKMAMLTTRADDGDLLSRPMAMQEIEFDGDLWFFAESSSASVAHIAADPHVNVSAYTNDTWISVSGSATVVHDQTKKDELWNPVVEAWFPDGPGPDVVLIKVEASGAEYWQSAGGRLATAVSFVKAKLTHERYDGGDNATVDLTTDRGAEHPTSEAQAQENREQESPA